MAERYKPEPMDQFHVSRDVWISPDGKRLMHGRPHLWRMLPNPYHGGDEWHYVKPLDEVNYEPD